MKDNRSLEQKIKAVVRESNEKRNSEIRMKMSNVGRPTDNVKDETSKLAKQGEIKTKIIDEDSEYGMARNELETAKRAIDRLKTKMGKGEGELEAWVQSKITKASDYLDTVADYIESGSVKEEAIDEAGRVLPDLTQKEPEKKHSKEYLSRMPKKRDNGLWKAYVKTGAEWAKPEGVKEETIEEDSVASVSTKDTPKEQPESGKKKKENQKQLLEPGKITGGKTEVDTEPTTDDRDDDGKKIDDKAKKATKAANAQAGVKEETMNTTKHFGLPADLIATVAEALKGNQKNIDKNHNGKIDKEDFKILQGKKAEKIKAYRADRDKHGEMEEEVIDEAVNHREFGSKGKMHPTMAKGMKVGQHADFYGHGNGDKHYGMVTKNTGTAVHIKAAGKTHKFSVSHNVSEEAEELDEISRKTVSSYYKKAQDDIKPRLKASDEIERKTLKPDPDRDRVRKIGNRFKGLDLARAKAADTSLVPQTARVMVKEETGPGFSEAELAHIDSIINEDSKYPYTSKSGKHIDSHMTDHDEPEGKPDHKIHLNNGDSVHVHYIKGENGKTKKTVMSHSGDYTSGSYSVPGKAHPKHIETSWNKALKPEHDYDD